MLQRLTGFLLLTSVKLGISRSLLSRMIDNILQLFTYYVNRLLCIYIIASGMAVTPAQGIPRLADDIGSLTLARSEKRWRG